MTENWKEATNKAIANNLVDSIGKLLNAKSVRYFSCSDKTTEHKKIVIEYDHVRKEKP
jgi:hypothetical protein|tara:strand:+ start:365 stop:538 length:174 start_codon:yes stop_codon:yes gene_type:complete